jgi:hypothetical protein
MATMQQIMELIEACHPWLDSGKCKTDWKVELERLKEQQERFVKHGLESYQVLDDIRLTALAKFFVLLVEKPSIPEWAELKCLLLKHHGLRVIQGGKAQGGEGNDRTEQNRG